MITSGSIKPIDLKDKVIFWDIDDTLAPYRFNGHIADPIRTVNGVDINEVEDGLFLDREPSRFMMKVIAECEASEHIIMGHYFTETELLHKHLWLDKYFPKISSRLFSNFGSSKADVILEYCENNGILISHVVFVDDTIQLLKDAETKGITSWHISSFLDFFMN